LDEYLRSHILIVTGIIVILIQIASSILKKYQSCQVLGLLIVVFSILNAVRHLENLPILLEFEELTVGGFYFAKFYFQELIWLIVSIVILIKGLHLLLIGNRIKYKSFRRTKTFKLIIGAVLILFFLEVPIWGLHRNFGGHTHGHSFWDGGTHIH